MRRTTLWLLLVVLASLSFAAGFRMARSRPDGGGGRRVLYYVDPMNPAFRSAKPGIAPCGMALEPVYADGDAPGKGALPPGAIAVRPDRQQLIGVTVAPVERRRAQHTLRFLGRVAVDESRVYQVSAGTRGWIREIGSATTGSLVQKGQVLAAYYAPEVFTPQQTFLYTVNALENLKKTGSNPYDNLQGGGQIGAYQKNIQTGRQTLLNYGMTNEQIDEIVAARKPSTLVQLRSPARGFVLSRNFALGQWFDVGAELCRIADLRRVWVLADAFEGDERFLRPGAAATVTLPGSPRSLNARVSDVPPEFDAAARTLKVRLELDNPGLALRPGMFVDVDLPVDLGPAIAVPKEAVLDSGTRRFVFVETRAGTFERRQVEIGWRHGGQVQVLSGLMEGEKVVTSGNFLLDSESRMRAASSPARGAAAADPVCGMPVDEAAARGAGLTSVYEGVTHAFCTPACKEEFDRAPARHVPGTAPTPPRARPPAHPGHAMDAAPPQGPARRAAPGAPVQRAMPEGHAMESMPHDLLPEEAPAEPMPDTAAPDEEPEDGGAGQ